MSFPLSNLNNATFNPFKMDVNTGATPTTTSAPKIGFGRASAKTSELETIRTIRPSKINTSSYSMDGLPQNVDLYNSGNIQFSGLPGKSIEIGKTFLA